MIYCKVNDLLYVEIVMIDGKIYCMLIDDKIDDKNDEIDD
jgi:hypothetical protein